MKQLIVSIISLCALLIASEAAAQWSLSGKGQTFSMLYYKTQGLGTTIEYGYANPWRNTGKLKLAGGLTLNGYLPKSYTYEWDTYNYETNTDETVEITENLSAFTVNAFAKMYIAGTYDQSTLGWYFKMGAGYTAIPYTIESNNSDEGILLGPEKGTITSLTVDLGTGIEFKTGFGHVFVEGNLYLPPTEENGVAVEPVIPASSQIAAGLRFDLGTSTGSRGGYRKKSSGYKRKSRHKRNSPYGSRSTKRKTYFQKKYKRRRRR